MARLDLGLTEKRNGAARQAFKSTANDLVEDLLELREDAERLAHAARKAAQAEIDATGARIDHFKKSVRNRAKGEVRALREHVRESPGAAFGAVLGAGVLLGLFLSTRRR